MAKMNAIITLKGSSYKKKSETKSLQIPSKK